MAQGRETRKSNNRRLSSLTLRNGYWNGRGGAQEACLRGISNNQRPEILEAEKEKPQKAVVASTCQPLDAAASKAVIIIATIILIAFIIKNGSDIRTAPFPHFLFYSSARLRIPKDRQSKSPVV